MPRAEMGSLKQISNQMKSKGLQRLRWYCQACSRQMRDENGFKCHVASESHVRNMMIIGEDPRKAINEFSNQFQSDFLKLLRTGHGEKKINVNHFYQEYISNKEHVHMNATKWASLTEFAKYLGREGICRVEEEEEDSNGRGGGLMVSWIDNTPEALRRQDALRKKERQDRGDEEREWKGIREQIAKARKEGQADDQDADDEARTLQRKDGETIKLTFAPKKPPPAATDSGTGEPKPPSPPSTDKSGDDSSSEPQTNPTSHPINTITISLPAAPSKLTLKPSTPSTTTTNPPSNPKNIFTKAPAQKNPLSATTKKPKTHTPNAATPPRRPMSEAERIMREEIERKQRTDAAGGHAVKRRRMV
jgi:DNA/RNA-binding protein KIN17